MHTRLLSPQGSSPAHPLAGPGPLSSVHSPQSKGGGPPTAQMWKLRAWEDRSPNTQLLSHKAESQANLPENPWLFAMAQVFFRLFFSKLIFSL